LKIDRVEHVKKEQTTGIHTSITTEENLQKHTYTQLHTYMEKTETEKEK